MENTKRPNILLILNDDMGFSDLGCYGGEIDTPNLDRLSAGGLRFSQFYNTARCCPSRASLLTGLHPHQVGVGDMVGPAAEGFEGYEGTINERCVTIAEALRADGYATSISGKWHLSGDHVNDNKSWPTSRGFDHHYGIITGAADYYFPHTLMRDHTNVEDEAYKDPDYYFTDAISEDAVRSINRHFSEPINKPLFQYVAYTAPHWPLHAREKDITKYKGRFQNGWDRLREERLERMIGMGLIDPKWALSPSNSSRPDRDVTMPAWEDVSHKEWQQRRMEVYAAQIDVMDQGIGRIVLSLEEHGQLDSTLIIFLADNGGEAGGPSTGMADEKWALELGIFNQTTKAGESVRFGNTPDVWPGDQNTYASYGASWANLSNTPFRLYKGWIHEGGIATPFIVHWPKGMKASPGAIDDSPWQLPDIMATLLDISGTPYPTDFAGRDVLPLEGRSFASVLDGHDMERSAPLFWEHEGNAAVRDGRWKLVRNYWHARNTSMSDPLGWELYDMVADRTELNDLSTAMPGRVLEMLTMFMDWTHRCNVVDEKELRN